MARWTTKGDPPRVVNWLATLRYDTGDRLRIVRVAGVGSIGLEVVASWSDEMMREQIGGTDVFAQSILDLAQAHCDAQQCRQEYRLEYLRGDSETAAAVFGLRMEPSDGTAFDDEDASPAGQIRQQMAFARQMMANSQRIPLMALEALARQLDIAHQRITELEKERAAMFDTYAEALSMIAEAQAAREPAPTLTQQVGEVTKVAPGIIGLVKSLLTTPAAAPAAASNVQTTGIVRV